ncbi:MAG TPA: uridine kinase [Crocinitomix sp.]|nr:uridine kinase [Crocinitomix sp.]
MKNIKFIVGITGGSGVGKTTLIKKLYKEFEGKITTLSLDNYYKPKEQQVKDENGVTNFDLPTALDTVQLKNDLLQLLENKAIKQKVYTFNNPKKEEAFLTIEPNEILIVEGLFVMHYPFIRERLNYSVYLSVKPELQLERRLKRDMTERNYTEESIIYQWENHVTPAYAQFVEPYKSMSDLIITNNEYFDDNIHVLTDAIHRNID